MPVMDRNMEIYKSNQYRQKEKAKVLPAFHVLTDCDITGRFFFRIRNKHGSIFFLKADEDILASLRTL